MQTRPLQGRRLLLRGLALFGGLLSLATAPVGARASAGADALVFDGTLSFQPAIGPFPQGSISIGFSGTCPLGLTEADLPGDQGTVIGACTSISGQGSFLSQGCGVGAGTGSLAITEFSGDPLTVEFSMVMLANVMILVAPSGLSDDGSTGSAIGAMVLVPLLGQVPPQTCVTAVSTLGVTGVLGGQH